MSANRHTELTLQLQSTGLSPLSSPAQEAYQLNYQSCSNKTLLPQLCKVQFSNVPCLADKSGLYQSRHREKDELFQYTNRKSHPCFPLKQLQFSPLFIIYICLSSLLDVQNLTSKSSHLSNGLSLQTEPRSVGEVPGTWFQQIRLRKEVQLLLCSRECCQEVPSPAQCWAEPA